MMREVRCPQCKSTAITMTARGDMDWDGGRWWPTGGWDRVILYCSDCSHAWRTKRAVHELEKML